jgi:hypothetical protein
MSGPMLFTWNGHAMEPLSYFARAALERFKVGLVYRMEIIEQRSANSHKHLFACIGEAFRNLPEGQEDRWSDPDHLRLWALTFTSFRETRTFTASSHAEARRLAKFLASDSDYCRVEISGRTVIQHKPMSQSYASMNRRQFQQSKDEVLDVLARKVGVTVEDLEANAGRAA